MRDATVEAYQDVEHELISEEDFHDFVFVDPIKLYAGINRDFFKGTLAREGSGEGARPIA